jgi:hypothetical protein
MPMQRQSQPAQERDEEQQVLPHAEEELQDQYGESSSKYESMMQRASTVRGSALYDFEKRQSTMSGTSRLDNATQSVVSRIRSREPGQTGRFSHHLAHVQTNGDVIVDFDSEDDPYRPLNWNFTKKAVATVLYGLTTLGKF